MTLALILALALGALSAVMAQETQPTTQPEATEAAAPAAPAEAPAQTETTTVTGLLPPESHPEIVGIIVCFAALDESMVGNRCTVEGYLIEKGEGTVTVADDHDHFGTLVIESSTGALEPGDFVRGTGRIVAGDEGPSVVLENMYHVVLAMGHGEERQPHSSSHIDPTTIEPVPY
jgi:hypothetical protein